MTIFNHKGQDDKTHVVMHAQWVRSHPTDGATIGTLSSVKNLIRKRTADNDKESRASPTGVGHAQRTSMEKTGSLDTQKLKLFIAVPLKSQEIYETIETLLMTKYLADKTHLGNLLESTNV